MKILCVGSNYSRHAREMGSRPPTEPVWFWKPESAILHDGQEILLPPQSHDVHHEVELALRIGHRASATSSAAEARGCIDRFTVAIDVTARDLQGQAKKQGRPWSMAKGFDTFLPLGPWQTADGVDLQGLRLRLAVDEKVRQDAGTAEMTWDAATLVHLASQWTTLEPGDILLTGTPAGVGPLAPGEAVLAEVVDHVQLRVGVARR